MSSSPNDTVIPMYKIGASAQSHPISPISQARHHRKKKHPKMKRKEWHFKAYKNPAETIEALSLASTKKASLTFPRMIVLGILGGVYIGFGGMLAFTCGGGIDPTIGSSNPGLQKMLAGFTFPVGLMFIIIAGAELFTSNVLIMTIGLLTSKVKPRRAILVLIVSYLMNYLGTAIVGAFSVLYGNYLQSEPFQQFIYKFAIAKASDPSFGVLILRSIPANMLVGLAIVMSTAAEDISGKLLAIFIPIATFATIGMDHLIANEFYVQTAIFIGAPLGYGLWLWKNFLAVTIGNTIGGSLLGVLYWYAYLSEATLGNDHWMITWNCFGKKKKQEDVQDP